MNELIETYYFEKGLNNDGEFYLEKKIGGKWLCFKKGNIIKSIKLTKKSFKSLKTCMHGPTVQNYIKNNYDEGYCDVWHTNLPAVIKKKSPFVIQIFQYHV